MAQKYFRIPVYFVVENEESKNVYTNLTNIHRHLRLKFIKKYLEKQTTFYTRVHEPSQIVSLKGQNIYGWIYGRSGTERNELRTIVVAAAYDTAAVVPGLSSGSNTSGSGITALLALARTLQLFFNSTKAGDYNILFLLTSATVSEFRGTHAWLEHLDSKIKNQIEYVFVLDGLSDTHLHLHMHTIPTSVRAKELITRLSNYADEYGHNLTLDTSASATGTWPHTAFSEIPHQLPAALLSNRLKYNKHFPSRILDRDISLKSTHKIATNVRILALTIAQHVSNHTNENFMILKQLLDVDFAHINAWQQYLLNTPRFYPTMITKHHTAPIISSLEQELSAYTHTQTQTFSVFTENERRKFYDAPPFVNIHCYETRPPALDIFLMFGALAYLGIIYFTLSVLASQEPLLPPPKKYQ